MNISFHFQRDKIGSIHIKLLFKQEPERWLFVFLLSVFSSVFIYVFVNLEVWFYTQLNSIIHGKCMVIVCLCVHVCPHSRACPTQLQSTKASNYLLMCQSIRPSCDPGCLSDSPQKSLRCSCPSFTVNFQLTLTVQKTIATFTKPKDTAVYLCCNTTSCPMGAAQKRRTKCFTAYFGFKIPLY